MKRTLMLAAMLLAPALLPAQDRYDESMYYPGSFNWQFLKQYPDAARLFNGFDYGHAILYERLLTLPRDRATTALAGDFEFLTRDLLVKPPKFSIAEEAVMPEYARLAWPAKQAFDWAHLLHRQVYDLYADERLTPAARDALIERVTDAYLANSHYAFAAVPKAMSLMDDQPFSQRFRREQVRFNGLIWSYHWLQVGLYEPFLAGKTPAARREGVAQVVAHFRTMLADSTRYPSVMPMTAAVAPRFSAAHPRTAAIFDNLHMMHDIISDILASPTMSRDQKRSEILSQLAEMRNPSRNVMEWGHWHMMGEMMGGVGKMGGVAVP
ncbi:MAG: hypothetical protein ABJC19_03870 [Gemmatimonadota bacterium]